jgi:AcrR family transcriptional regulator
VTKGKTLPARRIARKRPQPKRAAERIRESARDLFYRQGIRAVGVDEIVSHAGVTKPSLYRSFPSKDELAADYLRHTGCGGLARFDALIGARPDEPRRQFGIWVEELLQKASRPDYRGCGTTNAAVEYPDRKHPARKVASEIKRQFRARLAGLAAAMGAQRPDQLGDTLMLLLEGVYASAQLFGPSGPAREVKEAIDLVIDGYLSGKRSA